MRGRRDPVGGAAGAGQAATGKRRHGFGAQSFGTAETGAGGEVARRCLADRAGSVAGFRHGRWTLEDRRAYPGAPRS